MPRDYRLYMDDILESCRKIRQFTEGTSFLEFKQNVMMQDAVMRNFEIIGEAVNQITCRTKSNLSITILNWLRSSDFAICWLTDISPSNWKPFGQQSKKDCPVSKRRRKRFSARNLDVHSHVIDNQTHKMREVLFELRRFFVRNVSKKVDLTSSLLYHCDFVAERRVDGAALPTISRINARANCRNCR